MSRQPSSSVPIAAGMSGGPAGLVGLEARVREDLANERREIDEMDMVDSIHESGSGTRNIPAAIGTLEEGWRDIESAVVGYAGDGGGGLRFAHHQVGPRQQLVEFERGRRDPLLAPLQEWPPARADTGPTLYMYLWDSKVLSQCSELPSVSGRLAQRG